MNFFVALVALVALLGVAPLHAHPGFSNFPGLRCVGEKGLLGSRQTKHSIEECFNVCDNNPHCTHVTTFIPNGHCFWWTGKPHCDYHSGSDWYSGRRIFGLTRWVDGPSYNHKVTNFGKHEENLVFSAPAGWAIIGHSVWDHGKFGHSGYAVKTIAAAGTDFHSRTKIHTKLQDLIDISGKYLAKGHAKANAKGKTIFGAETETLLDFKTRLERQQESLYESETLVQASLSTIEFHCKAEGTQKLWGGGGWLKITTRIQMMRTNLDYLVETETQGLANILNKKRAEL